MPYGRRIEISGTVQGVGFRPWVYRLARSAGLSGSVRNDTRGVTIEAFGPEPSIDRFLRELESTPPPAASIRALSSAAISIPAAPAGFSIVASAPTTGPELLQLSIPPDLATCRDCLSEIFDPADRRFHYPFTNCTNCGPRFTIVEDLPYDRPKTTMAGFEMCPSCRVEYEDPADRRFHAQPNACPDCGPQLELWDGEGKILARRHDALEAAATALVAGRIVAAKGLGGFHLLVDARNQAAVARLRRRKHRPGKPLAVMAPDLDSARRLCEVSEVAAEELLGAEAPIVLLPRRDDGPIAPAVSAESPYCGVMLPYTPLHHLLLAECSFPLVATSGNLSDEPIAIGSRQALDQLRGVPDLYLVHDRPITRHADDSIVWLPDGSPRALRRARGYAPRAVGLGRPLPTILAVGAHQKNVVALTRGSEAFLSQHIGDMETPRAIGAFERVIEDFLRIFDATPDAVAHDLHPDYPSTHWTARHPAVSGTEIVGVQHHHAHLASCLADNGETGPALGVTWDGTGYGSDGTIWGGEMLLGDARGFTRAAHLYPFRLPGGEAAVREPRRSGLALLWELLGEAALEREDLAPIHDLPRAARSVLGGMLRRRFGSPATTSAGRLFDGVASLLGLHQKVSFEGQAAIALEAAADPSVGDAYPVTITPGRSGGAVCGGAGCGDGDGLEPHLIDWRPTIAALLEDRRRGAAVPVAAARFHNALATAVTEVALLVEVEKVALTGGCFQNRLLTERTTRALQETGFRPLLHRQVPPNDGGICLGQIAIAAAHMETKED